MNEFRFITGKCLVCGVIPAPAFLPDGAGGVRAGSGGWGITPTIAVCDGCWRMRHEEADAALAAAELKMNQNELITRRQEATAAQAAVEAARAHLESLEGQVEAYRFEIQHLTEVAQTAKNRLANMETAAADANRAAALAGLAEYDSGKV